MVSSHDGVGGIVKSVCVYCGSSSGHEPRFRDAAKGLGALLAAQDIRLVYGGGNVGLMAIIADSCLIGGGEVTGVITEPLRAREVAHLGLTELIIVQTMHQRKQRMVDLADGFIALPGAIGTLDELFEAFTWRQLGIHDKPVGVLNILGYFDPMLRQLDRMVEGGFLKKEHKDELLVEEDAFKLLERMRSFKPSHTGKWIDKDVI